MPDGVELTMLRTTEQLEALMPAWRGLCHQDQCCTPFQTPEWLVPWWHSFGNGNLRIVTLSQNSTLIGILPFYLYSGERDADRRLLPLGVGTTDYLDGVFASTCEGEHIRAALNLLCEDEDWDDLNGSQLRPCSKLLAGMKGFSERCSVFETKSCSRMDAVRIVDLPQKIRRNLMYYRNRAMRCGALELEPAGAGTCADSFDALVQLHGERWQERGCPGVLADPHVLAWHREALPLLERSGMLRFYTLRLNDEVIGVVYSLVDFEGRPHRTQYFYLTGYSTKHADLRPGTISLGLAIEDAFNNGVQTIDMLRGDEEYKRLWHLHPQPTYGLSLRKSAIAGRRVQESDKAA